MSSELNGSYHQSLGTNHPKRNIFEHPFKLPERKRKTGLRSRQERKEVGICRDCPNEAVPDQVRCSSCAGKHRTWRQHNKEQRLSSEGATPHQPTPGNSETTLQKSLPIDVIAEGKSPAPKKNGPTAIRPHPRTRGRVNKNLQQYLPMYQQPDPPVSP